MAPIMFATAVALRAMHARITSTSARSTCCMTAVPTLMAITQTMDLCDDVDNMLDNTCEVIRQETVLFSTPETDYIIYD